MSSKNMQKKFNSVSDLLRHVTEPDDTVAVEFEDRLKQREIIKRLVALRVTSNMSQADIAVKMQCSQSCISKLENGTDDDLKLGEYRKYLIAVGMEPVIGALKHDRTIVDEIKMLSISIRQRLEKLAAIAEDDDTVAAGIANFYADAFYNFCKMLAESSNKLPSRPDGSGPYIQFGYIEEHVIASDVELRAHASRLTGITALPRPSLPYRV